MGAVPCSVVHSIGTGSVHRTEHWYRESITTSTAAQSGETETTTRLFWFNCHPTSRITSLMSIPVCPPKFSTPVQKSRLQPLLIFFSLSQPLLLSFPLVPSLLRVSLSISCFSYSSFFFPFHPFHPFSCLFVLLFFNPTFSLLLLLRHSRALSQGSLPKKKAFHRRVFSIPHSQSENEIKKKR